MRNRQQNNNKNEREKNDQNDDGKKKENCLMDCNNMLGLRSNFKVFIKAPPTHIPSIFYNKKKNKKNIILNTNMMCFFYVFRDSNDQNDVIQRK